MTRRVALLLVAVLAAESSWALGRSGIGTTGAQFLRLAPGARPAGMGGAFAGVADDAFASYYNPAGLGFLERVEAAGMHHAHFQDIRYQSAAMALPVLAWVESKEPRNAWGVLGLAVYNLSVAGLERRGTTETDAPSGSFGASDFAYAAAYGLEVTPGVALGAAGKIIDQRLDSARATAAALDAGALYSRGRLSLGAGFRNLGSRPRFVAEADPLPFEAYAGGGWRPRPGWLLAADLRLPRAAPPGLSLGGEYTRRFSSQFAASARAGFDTSRRDTGGLSGASIGAGLSFKHLRFDFAWAPYDELGNSFRYSVSVVF